MSSTSPIPDQVAESKKTWRSLPAELLVLIANHAASVQDVWALSLSNKYFDNTLRNSLYEYDAKDIQPRALLWAAVNGNISLMEKALWAGTDLDTQFTRSFCIGDYHGLTPVLAAAASGHIDMVRHLLDAGADPRGLDQTGFNALHYAARAGDEEIVKYLLDRFPPLLYDIGRDDLGLPAAYAAQQKPILRLLAEAMHTSMCASSLEAAALYGYDDICEWLIGRGVGLVDGYHAVVERRCLGSIEGHVNVARCLIRASRRPHWWPKNCQALYDVCRLNGPKALEMSELFKEYGASTKRTLYLDDTPLSAACTNGNAGLVKMLLLETPSCLEHKFWDRFCIQHAACRSPNMECGNLVLERFPLKEPDNHNGTQLLIEACLRKNEGLVKLLLDRGVRANSDNDCCHPKQVRPYCPLEAAWIKGSMNIMKLLIDRGAKCDQLDRHGHGFLTNPQWTTGDEDHQLSCLKFLLSKNANPVAVSKGGYTPLHAACLAGAVGCARLLLESHKADATLASRNSHMTPLHAAVKSGKLEIVKMLVDRKANVAATYREGRTALHDACELEQPTEMVEYLLSKGADPNAHDLQRPFPEEQPSYPKYEFTPLICLLLNRQDAPPPRTLTLLIDRSDENLDGALTAACTKGYFAAARTLLDRGADVNTRRTGTTPLCSAVQGYHLDIVKLLVARGAGVNVRNILGQSPLGIQPVAHGGIVKFLLESGASIAYAFDNDPAIPSLEDYRENGRQAECEPSDNAEALAERHCVYTHNRRALELLLDKGGLEEVLTPEQWQKAVNQAAARNGGNLVRLLLERKLASIPDWGRETPYWHVHRDYQSPETLNTIDHLHLLLQAPVTGPGPLPPP